MTVFEEFWTLHGQWASQTPIIKETIELTSSKLYLSDVPGEFFNFAVPKTESPGNLDLAEIGKNGIYLFEKYWHCGFLEHLTKNGYKFLGTDCWLVSGRDANLEMQISTNILEVSRETFPDFYKVMSVVFKNFSGNKKYLEVCRDSLTNKTLGCDLQSKFFLIYEGGKPVSGAGVFFSQANNIAYFHNAGTLENFRGKGYQTSLIKHRLKLVRDLGINRIYAITELGSSSWKNYLKLGFDQAQVAVIMAPNKKP